MSKYTSSGRDGTNIPANSKRGEHLGITVTFENVCERKNTLHLLSTNDETRNSIPVEVTELLVPGTHFDRQPDTHHSSRCNRRLELYPLFLMLKVENPGSLAML